MMLPKKKTYCYQRYTFIIVCLSLVTLFIYISYTDGLRHDFLPRLTSHVRKTVCSVMTLPCLDEEEEEGYANKYGGNKSNRGQQGGRSRDGVGDDGLYDDALEVPEENDRDDGRNRITVDGGKTVSSRPLDKYNKNKLGNVGRAMSDKIDTIVNIDSPEDDKMKSIDSLKINPHGFQVKDKFTVGRGVKSVDGSKPRPDSSSKINSGTNQRELVNGSPDNNTDTTDYNRSNGGMLESFQDDTVNKSKKNTPNSDVKVKAKATEVVKEPTDKADVRNITQTNKPVPAPKQPPSAAVVEMKGNTSSFSSPTSLSSKSLASSSSTSSGVINGESMTQETEPFPLLNFIPEVTMKDERNFLATQDSSNKQNLPNSSENMTSVAKMERKFLGSVNSTESRHLQISESLYLGERWKGKTLQPLLDDKTEFSLMTDHDFLKTYLESGGLNMSLLSRAEWDTKPLHYELDLLKDPPLDNITHAANNLKSKVYLLNPRNCYNISDIIKFRVDVYDGTGAALKRGGDEIRAWIEEEGKNASVAGTVTDLKNGSYIVRIALKWTGVQKVHVDLTYPRELLRSLYYLRYALKCLRYIVAGYAKGPLSEATLCSPFSLIPGYPRLCNYTDPTYGLTWFCGHPRKTALTCDDWVSIRDLEFPRPLPLTVAEESLLNGLKQPPPFRLIPNDIFVNVTGGKPWLPKLPCSAKRLRETWNISQPRGFLLHGHWVRTDCLPIQLSNVVERSCLTNTTLVFTGDSNLLMFYTHMQTRTQCIDVHTTPHSQTWHRPRLCIRPEINFRMTWALHGYPVHPVSDHWATKTDFQEVTDVIRLIPSEGRYIVVVHLFIHFSIHHYSVFANRMAAAKMAVEDLVNRNPDAIVVIRGPHTASTGWPPHLGGDVMGLLMREMTVRLFQNLHDRVLFLDFWDMTIATKNPTFHPEKAFSIAMLNILLQDVCSEK